MKPNPAIFAKASLLVALLSSSALLAQDGFWGAVGFEDREACGLTKLDEAQQGRLGELIQRDLDAARQGGVTGFAKTFSQRRTKKESEESGLLLLSDAERARVDALVADSMLRGGRSMTFVAGRSRSSADSVETEKRHGTVHGSMTFVVGTSGGGRNFYGAGADVSYTDPSEKLTATVGYSYLKGRGCLYPYDPYYYGDPYWFGRRY